MISNRSSRWLAAHMWLIALGACGSKSDAPKTEQIAGPSTPQLGFDEAQRELDSAPITLTASDGSGLLLVALEARTVIDDPLAFTELHLTFRNPEARRREGRFQIVLPEAAAISRFAMKVGSEFQEGEVVERRRAQQVYEDFLHRKQDPALLEKAAGNEFSARVFPIEPNAEKEIIVSYSEELAQRSEPYRLLVAGLPRMARFSVDVRLGSHSATGLESSAAKDASSERLQLSKQDYAPPADLLVRLPWRKPFALRSGNLVVARVRPIAEATPEKIDSLTVLFDTSASRALGFTAQIERLGGLLGELVRQNGKDFELRLLAFDQDTEEVYQGPASGFSLRDKGRLLARAALGATDLSQALAVLSQKPSEHARLLLVSDGMLSAGEADGTRMREAVARLSAHGLRRLDVLAEGGIRDRGLLSSLTHAGLKSAGCVLDAQDQLPAIATRLLRSVRESIQVQMAGARWVHPSALASVQAGDERLIFAELPEDEPVQIELSGAGNQALETQEVPRPLLERAWARAKIDALTETLHGAGHLASDQRQNLERSIVELSTQHRVLSDLTALLVLETADDFERFGIAQNALTSILQVADEGLALVDRKARAVQQIARPVELAKGNSFDEGERPELPPPTVEQRQAPLASRRGRSSEGADPAAGNAFAAAPRRTAPSERAAEPESDQRDKDREPEPKASVAAERAGGSAPGPELARSRGAAQPAALPSTPSPAAPAKAASSGLGGIGQGAPALDALASAGAPAHRPSDVQIAAPALLARAQISLHGATGLPQAAVAQLLRSALGPRARACYQRSGSTPGHSERVYLDFSISERGSVSDVYVSSGALADSNVRACLLTAAHGLQFPKPEGGAASVQAGVELSLVAAAPPSLVAPATQPVRSARPRAVKVPTPALEDAYSGELAAVLAALRGGDTRTALALAQAAHDRAPGDVLGLIALGEALEAQRELPRAARVYGSLIDLFPGRPDLRRMAGARLERLSQVGLALAVDTYRVALQQRPDHPSAHRLLAYALLKQGAHELAFQTLEAALGRSYAADRFAAAERILGEDLALVGAAWARSQPNEEPRVRNALQARGLALETKPSLRFVLNWETDANDVDFHIYDGRGGHASYMKPRLGSGGALYADITTGYGPECFAIPGAARSYPYVLQAHYFARGPMGYGMGKLQVVEHDGKGVLKFAEHPFVIMKDKAFVELARLTGPLG